MRKPNSIAPQTRNNWLIDAVLFLGAIIASLTGIYFLFLPVGGYQGGRNPLYGVTIFFERHTWEDLHLWFGLLMIVAALVHIVIHWNWIVSMARRVWGELTQGQNRFNRRSRYNLLINAAIGLSFIITALSGLYLFFVPGGSHGVVDPVILFTRTTWDLIHTWAGILMIAAAVIHFSIHWRWVVKVSGKMVKASLPDFDAQSTPQITNL
ncbi:MAG TPA: hypothetical protein DEH22_13045 [Chloroflexi bacterium]|nr:hypothetical protein [Chloroflexota bacterium]